MNDDEMSDPKPTNLVFNINMKLSFLNFAGNLDNFGPCCSLSVKFEEIISDKLFQLVHIPSDHLIPIVRSYEKGGKFS